MSAIMISLVTVTDPTLFTEYMQKTQVVAGRFGAQIVTRGKFAGSLAGEGTPHGMAVVVRFPSIEQLRAWNTSPEYQALIQLREQGSVQVMTCYEEVV